jgi:hypothetical protein
MIESYFGADLTFLELAGAVFEKEEPTTAEAQRIRKRLLKILARLREWYDDFDPDHGGPTR